MEDEQDEEMQQIQLEYQTLLLEEEEYIAIGKYLWFPPTLKPISTKPFHMHLHVQDIYWRL
jgi:hypothetical protein